jgi:hypothetical protein
LFREASETKKLEEAPKALIAKRMNIYAEKKYLL